MRIWVWLLAVPLLVLSAVSQGRCASVLPTWPGRADDHVDSLYPFDNVLRSGRSAVSSQLDVRARRRDRPGADGLAWQVLGQDAWRPSPDPGAHVSESHTLTVSARSSQFMLPSRGSAALTGMATDSWGESIASWFWSDGGAGGSFSDPSAQNPTYAAPANSTVDALAIVLTAAATSAGPDPISASDSTLVMVQRAVSTPTPAAEAVAEVWRGVEPSRSWGAVSVDPVDGSCWVAVRGSFDGSVWGAGGMVIHLAVDGTVLWSGTDFTDPVSVSVNPADGSCWVADEGAGEVTHLAQGGALLWRGAAFWHPRALSANPADGSCWVADAAHNQIVHLAADGTELWRGGDLLYPESVSVNPADGSCWACAIGTVAGGEVAHLAADGQELWHGTGFANPYSVSVNPADGSCWVGDTGSGAEGPEHVSDVVHLAPDGTELWRAASFNLSWSVSANLADGSCWVADAFHGQVVHLAPDGHELWRGEPRGYPESVAVNPTDGSCWVAYWDGSISHLGVWYALTIVASADPATVISGGTTQLAAAAADTSGPPIASWSWSDAGAGGSFSPSSSVQNPTYTTPANHTGSDLTVTLSVTATCPGDLSTTASTDLVITPTPPSADFSAAPTSGVAPLAVAFTYPSPATPTWAAATSWDWQFGDGEASIAQKPSHTYAKPGSYTVSLTASGAGGSITATKPDYITVTFGDVPIDSWALDQILACVNAGIVNGYPDGSYQPAAPVTRDQMAVYISRALAGGDAKVSTPPATASFPDVDIEYWAYKYIEYAKSRDIVTGFPDGTYGPTLSVDRGQMAVYISRAIASPAGDAGLASYNPPASPSFPDVAADFWAYKYVEYAKAKGVVNGYPDGTYQPAAVVTRDQMAVYVARAFQLPM